MTEESPASEQLTAKERLMAEKAALAKEKQKMQVKEWRVSAHQQMILFALVLKSQVFRQYLKQEVCTKDL